MSKNKINFICIQEKSSVYAYVVKLIGFISGKLRGVCRYEKSKGNIPATGWKKAS